MEFDLLPQIIIVISIGIIIVLLGRNISKINDLDEDDLFFDKTEAETEKEKFFYLYNRIKKRVNREEYTRKISLMLVWSEKLLRKIRINFLKIDNKIIFLLAKLREKSIKTKIEIDKNKKTDIINKDEESQELKEVVVTEEQNDIFKKKGEVLRENIICEENKEINLEKQEKIEENVVEMENVQKEIPEDIIEDSTEYSKRENTKGKEKEYIDLILKNPIDIKAYWKLGIVYSRRRNYQDAIACFLQITKIDPTYEKAKKKVLDLIERTKKNEIIDNKENIQKKRK